MDNLGTTAHSFDKTSINLRNIFDSIRKSGLEITILQYEFGLLKFSSSEIQLRLKESQQTVRKLSII